MAQIPTGKARHGAGVPLEGGGVREDEVFMPEPFVLLPRATGHQFDEGRFGFSISLEQGQIQVNDILLLYCHALCIGR